MYCSRPAQMPRGWEKSPPQRRFTTVCQMGSPQHNILERCPKRRHSVSQISRSWETAGPWGRYRAPGPSPNGSVVMNELGTISTTEQKRFEAQCYRPCSHMCQYSLNCVYIGRVIVQVRRATVWTVLFNSMIHGASPLLLAHV
jgi:hypothetical protein